MTIDELKIRLKITDTSQDEYLDVVLEDALEYSKEYCRQDFADGLPSGVKQAIAKLVKSYGESSNVASMSLGDMSKSFFNNGGTLEEVNKLLKPYKRMRML